MAQYEIVIDDAADAAGAIGALDAMRSCLAAGASKAEGQTAKGVIWEFTRSTRSAPQLT